MPHLINPSVFSLRYWLIQLVGLVAMSAAALVGDGWLQAADLPADTGRFRVDSTLFAGDHAAPSSAEVVRHHVTLIDPKSNGLSAYDFITDEATGEPAGEVTIYDAAKMRFTLLDLNRKVRMEMPLKDVIRLVAHAQTLAQQQEGLWPIAASGKFDQISWPSQNRLRMTAPAMTYEIDVLVPPQPASDAVTHYQEFADAFARWNTVRTGLPPRARQVLNQQLANRGVLPESVALTCDIPGQGTVKQMSRHRYTWQWSAQDQQRVSQFLQLSLDFARLPARDYLRQDSAKR